MLETKQGTDTPDQQLRQERAELGLDPSQAPPGPRRAQLAQVGRNDAGRPPAGPRLRARPAPERAPAPVRAGGRRGLLPRRVQQLRRRRRLVCALPRPDPLPHPARSPGRRRHPGHAAPDLAGPPRAGRQPPRRPRDAGAGRAAGRAFGAAGAGRPRPRRGGPVPDALPVHDVFGGYRPDSENLLYRHAAAVRHPRAAGVSARRPHGPLARDGHGRLLAPTSRPACAASTASSFTMPRPCP